MRKLVRYSFIIVFVFAFCNSFAQNNLESSIEYRGKVFNKKTGEILKGVTLIYTDPKTGEISGTITSETGGFLITVPKTVPYLTFSLKDMAKKKLILSEVDSAQYLKLEIFLKENKE